jgi:hypothetical protein
METKVMEQVKVDLLDPDHIKKTGELLQEKALKDAEKFFFSNEIPEESVLVSKANIPTVNIDDSRIVTTLRRIEEQPHTQGLVTATKSLLECYSKINLTATPTGAKSVFGSIMSVFKNPLKNYWQEHQDLAKLLQDNFVKGMKYAVDAKNEVNFAKTVIKNQNAEYQKRAVQLAYADQFLENLKMLCETEYSEPEKRKRYKETYLIPAQDALMARHREYNARIINYVALQGIVINCDKACAKFLIMQPLANDVFHSSALGMKISAITDQINGMTSQLENYIDATLLHQVNTVKRQNEETKALKQAEIDSVDKLKEYTAEMIKNTEEARDSAINMFEAQSIALKNIQVLTQSNLEYLIKDEQKEKERETTVKQLAAMIS